MNDDLATSQCLIDVLKNAKWKTELFGKLSACRHSDDLKSFAD